MSIGARLSSRLGRLNGAGLQEKGEPRLSFGPPVARPAAPPTPSAPSEHGLLEDLRLRMEAILSREEKPKEPPRVDAGDLPFFVEQTEHGPLHVRQVRHGGE